MRYKNRSKSGNPFSDRRSGSICKKADKVADDVVEDTAKAIKSGTSSIVDKEKCTFIIKDWSNYPDDYVPVSDINNKTAIQSQVHRRYVTPWWNKIRDEVKKGLN